MALALDAWCLIQGQKHLELPLKKPYHLNINKILSALIIRA